MKLSVGPAEEGFEPAGFDPLSFPWECPDGFVDELVIQKTLERVPHWRPDYGNVDGWWLLWNEVYRVCKPDAKVAARAPYVKCDAAFIDPEHVRFVHERTFYYLSADFREQEALAGLDARCDFEVIVVSADEVDKGISLRANEAQAFSHRHYWNTVGQITVELRKR